MPRVTETRNAGKSPRAELVDKIVDHLFDNLYFWNAPYGVLPGMVSMPRGGKVRTVTFGIARYLDATATIWSVDKITLETRGGVGQHFMKKPSYTGEEFMALLAEMDGSAK